MSASPSRIRVSVASAVERVVLYRLRHDVYCTELGQYEERSDGSLPDAVDIHSHYVIATIDDTLVGFVGITAPDSPRFSVEKHLGEAMPVDLDEQTYEIRALTVREEARGSQVAAALMYAAFRWVEAHGGRRIVCIGRREVLGMYLRLGLHATGQALSCGDVTYDVLCAELADIRSALCRSQSQLERMERRLDWGLRLAFRGPSECYHGGAFFDAIGDQFDTMNRVESVINADVLDAWFPPAESAQSALREYLPWIMRTSPPTRADGLARTIGEIRGVDASCVLMGCGSSALIFCAFRHWLTPESRVLILDPSYGEYSHVLEQVVRCKVVRLGLERSCGYRLDLGELGAQLATGFDLFVWVNPNSPTGLHVDKAKVVEVLEGAAASCTRIWIDETYVEYAGAEQSLERFAAHSEHVIVCKSMSKVYALSGMRVGYLCASPHQLEPLRALTPPWSVGLAGQIAATHALRASSYYLARYQQTHELRAELVAGLQRLGIEEIVAGAANFVMFHLPAAGNSAAVVLQKCREQGLYLRDASAMGTGLGDYAIRMAVKDAATNHRMLGILEVALSLPVR
ncbi:MAG: histidinol-phosphate/aromatic aminotransferase/cobyric acid decarboxylase-like protein [Rhodothermales bacterium]|jgi:histidinol-phosphate/aromatic aminotransferase/cobyric acid decarboxylase-like protein/predicted GNAT family N-acyltransferase